MKELNRISFFVDGPVGFFGRIDLNGLPKSISNDPFRNANEIFSPPKAMPLRPGTVELRPARIAANVVKRWERDARIDGLTSIGKKGGH